MQKSVRMMQVAAALLYFGPLLAGLGGFGWSVVYIFALIFLLWLIVMKPQQFPRSLADWQRPEVLIGALTAVVVQLLLVAVCFGIGRGIGGALGALPPFPLMLPLAISFLAVPLARLVWDPWKAEELDNFLDDALRQLKAQPETDEARADRAALVAGMIEPLAELPAGTPDAELEGHLRALREHLDESALGEAMLARVQSGTAGPAMTRALVLLASDGAAIERMSHPDLVTDVLLAIADAPDQVAVFAAGLRRAVEADDDLVPFCPAPETLQRVAGRNPAAAADLERLAALVDWEEDSPPARDPV